MYPFGFLMGLDSGVRSIFELKYGAGVVLPITTFEWGPVAGPKLISE